MDGTIASAFNAITNYHAIKANKLIKHYIFKPMPVGSTKPNLDSVQVGKGFYLAVESFAWISIDARHFGVAHG
jgi:hypothetical protein